MRRCLAAVAAALVFAHVPVRGQTIVYEVFGAYLDSLRLQAGIPGLAAAIVDAQEVVWERGYGRQDVGRALPARPDTLFHADGLTQTLTATIVLGCAEERRLSLDDPIRSFRLPAAEGVTAEPDATIRQLLSHTSGPPDNLVYALRPERLAPLWPIVRACAIDSYRETLSNLLVRLAMFDSVPGANILSIVPPAEGVPDPEDRERYAAALQRRAIPYLVDRGFPLPTAFPETSAVLTPSTGLVTTVRDLAKFDLALKHGILLEPGTLAHAWSAPVGANGVPLPHGLGWFVQYYNGEKVVWQFGMTENAGSALMMTLPGRGLTLILMANSDGLVRLYSPANGDVALSPFARLFLNMFVR